MAVTVVSAEQCVRKQIKSKSKGLQGDRDRADSCTKERKKDKEDGSLVVKLQFVKTMGSLAYVKEEGKTRRGLMGTELRKSFNLTELPMLVLVIFILGFF